MPIRLFLNGEQFDQETARILGVAFEQVCIALRIGDCADDVKQAIANKIIELSKTGESNLDLLVECALKDIRQPGDDGLSQMTVYFFRVIQGDESPRLGHRAQRGRARGASAEAVRRTGFQEDIVGWVSGRSGVEADRLFVSPRGARVTQGEHKLPANAG